MSHPIHDTDVPIVFDSLLRIKLILQRDIRERVDNASKQFSGAGWKHLPQELVDEILGWLRDDLCALKACSLTCKPLFSATRPIIHKRVCLVPSLSWIERHKRSTNHNIWITAERDFPDESRRSLSIFRRRDPETLKRMANADRSGLLSHIRHITFKMEGTSFNPGNIHKYHPRLRSMTNLLSLTLMPFRAFRAVPLFSECFTFLPIPYNTPTHETDTSQINNSCT